MRSRLFLVLLTLSCLLPPLLAVARQTPPLPQSDAVDFLAYGRSLYLAQHYSRSLEGPQQDRMAGREPAYPLLIAGLAAVDPVLGAALSTCAQPEERCRQGYRGLIFANALLLGGAALLAAWTVARLGGGKGLSFAAGLYVALNLHLYKDMRFVESDYLALFLAALTAALLAALLTRPARLASWIGLGIALLALCLTKSIFLPYALLLCPALAVFAWNRQRTLLGAALLAALLLAGNLAWIGRNVALFGTPGDGRDGLALSTREIFDHMTPEEHIAAWLWWLRGPGPGLARRFLPEQAWHRHQWYAEDGFYLQGQVARPAERIAVLTAQGLAEPQAWAALKGVVAREILADWPHYLLTLPVLFYRGLWCDEFIVLGLPALLLVLATAIRRRRIELLLVLSPGLWSLLVYPAISLNLARYQYPSVASLAIATALVLPLLTKRAGLSPWS